MTLQEAVEQVELLFGFRKIARLGEAEYRFGLYVVREIPGPTWQVVYTPNCCEPSRGQILQWVGTVEIAVSSVAAYHCGWLTRMKLTTADLPGTELRCDSVAFTADYLYSSGACRN